MKRVNEAEGLAAALAGVVGEEAAEDYVKRVCLVDLNHV